MYIYIYIYVDHICYIYIYMTYFDLQHIYKHVCILGFFFRSFLASATTALNFARAARCFAVILFFSSYKIQDSRAA